MKFKFNIDFMDSIGMLVGNINIQKYFVFEIFMSFDFLKFQTDEIQRSGWLTESDRRGVQCRTRPSEKKSQTYRYTNNLWPLNPSSDQ